jgi:hypothetical protein
MERLWHWIIANWRMLSLATLFGSLLAAAFGAFKWVYPSKAAVTAKRQVARREWLDERVLAALSDPSIRRQSNGRTEAGYPLSRVSEIAAHIQEDRDAVYESLSRMEQRGRVRSSEEFWFPLQD